MKGFRTDRVSEKPSSVNLGLFPWEGRRKASESPAALQAWCLSLLGRVRLAGEFLQAEKLLTLILHLCMPQFPHVMILPCFP